MGQPAISMERVTDTLALARRKHPGAPANLDALCDRYRIDRSRRVKHGALLDAEILVEVYAELTGGRQKSLILASEPKVVSLAPRLTAARKSRPAPLSPRLAESELGAHIQHVSALGEAAIWSRYARAEDKEA